MDTQEELVDYYQGVLEQVFGGKRWIVATDVLAAQRGIVKNLQSFGADGALCIAASRGTGELPDPEFAPDPIVFDVDGEDMMAGIRASVEQLATLPSDALAQIDEFDPDGEVRAIGAIFDDGRPVGGREKYGARPRSWQALEDKTIIDDLWDRVGVERSDREIVGVNDVDALVAASERVDLGDGTVWVADNKKGFHGGGSYARWVRTADEAAAARESLGPHADVVRVMPFLEGIPCSIHGIVFEDYTAVLRPCEMLVFRRPKSQLFHYGKAATFWDPRSEDREEMRDIARRVGGHLRDAVDYRGAFTVDGVMTREGFRPTELNPRFGAALGVVASAVDIPFMLANLAIVEREPYEWHPRSLERVLVEAADEHRSGGTMAVVTTEIVESKTEMVVWDDDGIRRTEDGEDEQAKVTLGPAASGGIVFVHFCGDDIPAGPSFAPRAVEALRWVDEQYHLEIGRLEPALDVRPA